MREERTKPTLKQLEYFLAIAETGSFRKAAEKLNITQPTLTSQIASLENSLGLTLFERGRSGSILSSIGNRMLAPTKNIIEQVNQLHDLANHEELGTSGSFRLGIPATLGPYLLPHILPDIHLRYSKLQLHIREATPKILEDGLINGHYDLVLCPLPINEKKLNVVPLFREPMSLITRYDHPNLDNDNNAIDKQSLKGADVLIYEEQHHYYRQVKLLSEKLDMNLKREYGGTSLDGIRQMVLLGMGVSFLPSLYIASEIDSDSLLRVVTIEGESMERIHGVAWRKGSPSNHFFKQFSANLKKLVHKHVGNLINAI